MCDVCTYWKRQVSRSRLSHRLLHLPAGAGGQSWHLGDGDHGGDHDDHYGDDGGDDGDTWTHWVHHCRPVRQLQKLARALPQVPGHRPHQYWPTVFPSYYQC